MADASCPVPFSTYERVVLAHGGGGRVMHRLIDELFLAAFGADPLRAQHDGAVIEVSGPLAVTTDAFTVQPLVFPGGDIGSLAVHGTVNDLVCCGATPTQMTVSFILEEGLALERLRAIVGSMAAAAREVGLTIVAGDTKVVERGKGDGVFISATGLGRVITPAPLSPSRVRPGDAVLVTGPVGDHGVAVMLEREGLSVDTVGDFVSDAASCLPQLRALLDAGVDLRCLRDPTRGGLATVLNEIARAAEVGVHLDDAAVPVRAEVRDACELLGLDPLYVACEGRLVVFVPEPDAPAALAALRATPGSEGAARVGAVTREHAGLVMAASSFGTTRVLDLLSGEQLPRIC